MPVSVRLDPDLVSRLRKLAQRERASISDVVRRAVTRYFEQAANDRLDARLADIIGSVRSRGGRARHTGRTFTRLLKKRT